MDTADYLLDRGLAYFCAWGPESERVHDLVDWAIERRELDGLDYPPAIGDLRYLVMTTWHEEETLDDALSYLLVLAHPEVAYGATCKSRLAISVGSAAWASQIETRLRSTSDLGSGTR